MYVESKRIKNMQSRIESIIAKRLNVLKSLLQVININASKHLSVKRHRSDLNIRPALLKSRVLVIPNC